ncbi:hypothetical protein [Bacillus solitudinis]|uniref:hypothetical protein n=1 Tax=Bacillus solitudinis TaxID=2014074 RepID=UPI0012FE525F|nr:hypothetical protein [Bacillus solitudinis]
MNPLFDRTWKLLNSIDKDGIVFDKGLKWFIYLQHSSSYSSSLNWIGVIMMELV